MTIISPSLLACDFLNIESELNAFTTIENIWFHLDIMDGHFVPNLTFGHPIIELIVKKTPHKCDAHFMVTNPEFYADTLVKAGLHNFTFHFESLAYELSLKAQQEKSLELIKKLKKHYPSVGISIKPGTTTDKLNDEILTSVDLVLIMSVEPGFGGQSFMPIAYDKIRELKLRKEQLKAHFQIQIDGGVSDKNAKKLIEAGANNLVAGSYIFKNSQENYQTVINLLR